ncbi:OprO/OprP family phosphate-selective porin [Methylophaga pinxianii]|uniref:OprO/OprP family phosphate-selective porin n=1 Tax=Methylophaga pinxianii TaxID=2881052 RepID=UPI001CF35801|nr:porin [Methylophaga pinxianii]MCB2425807.1 OprO/OprP family phosphate-selective porin [Methylophaga pinxianii]UPH46259.1 OprO/OprP family phosphate-selective porin [Methylophaga pinxianii]
MKLKTSAILIAGALLGAATLPAQANNDAMMDLLKVLRDKGTISNDDYQLLTNAAAADKEMAEADKEELKKEVETATADMPKITTDGKLVVSDREGNWEFQPIGRVMWDAVNADADTGDSSDDVKGTELRRARLGFEGKIYDMGYKFEADFAGGDASIKDAYVSYGNSLTDTTKYGIKLGQSHIPFGLNTKISSKYMTFIDRPFFADSSVSPARASGVVAAVNDKDYKWALAAGLQNGGLDDGTTYEINGSTFAVRGSFLPYFQDEKHMIQLGAAYLTQGGGDEFGFRPDLVSHEDQFRPLNTTTIAANEFDGADAFTVDAMAIFGSFHAMAEYLDHTINQETGSDIDTSGYAIEAGYFLTGESLKWKKGYTSGVSPKSSYGAWQLAARFENIEIDNVGTSEYDKFTVGVNYYPTKNTRLMLNYDHVTDLSVDGASDAINSAEPSAIKFRAQAFW